MLHKSMLHNHKNKLNKTSNDFGRYCKTCIEFDPGRPRNANKQLTKLQMTGIYQTLALLSNVTQDHNYRIGNHTWVT